MVKPKLDIELSHNAQVYAIHFDPTNKYTATGDCQGVLRIFKTETGACIYQNNNAHSTNLRSLRFGPGKIIGKIFD